MATITFYYDDKSTAARKTLDFLMSLGLFKQQKPKISSLEQSLQDIEEGRVYRLVNRKK